MTTRSYVSYMVAAGYDLPYIQAQSDTGIRRRRCPSTGHRPRSLGTETAGKAARSDHDLRPPNPSYPEACHLQAI